MQFDPILLLYIPVFLFSLTVHEFAHAWTARMAGDMTAAYKGRLTLNPIAHIDLIGTIVLPGIALLSGFPLIGWAKPVPVNDLRFRKPIWLVWVSIAGPLSNILMALIAAVLLKLGLNFAMSLDPGEVNAGGLLNLRKFGSVLAAFGILFIQMNIVLAVFNMLPIPPLDGSKVLFHFVIRGNEHMYPLWIGLHRFGFFALYLLILVPQLNTVLRSAYGIPVRAIFSWVTS